jgi:hypothetical protein
MQPSPPREFDWRKLRAVRSADLQRGGRAQHLKSMVQILVQVSGEGREDTVKRKAKPTRAANMGRVAEKRPTVGARIIEGLEQAITWTRGECDNVRVTRQRVPHEDVH